MFGTRNYSKNVYAYRDADDRMKHLKNEKVSQVSPVIGGKGKTYYNFITPTGYTPISAVRQYTVLDDFAPEHAVKTIKQYAQDIPGMQKLAKQDVVKELSDNSRKIAMKLASLQDAKDLVASGTAMNVGDCLADNDRFYLAYNGMVTKLTKSDIVHVAKELCQLFDEVKQKDKDLVSYDYLVIDNQSAKISPKGIIPAGNRAVKREVDGFKMPQRSSAETVARFREMNRRVSRDMDR